MLIIAYILCTVCSEIIINDVMARVDEFDRGSVIVACVCSYWLISAHYA